MQPTKICYVLKETSLLGKLNNLINSKYPQIEKPIKSLLNYFETNHMKPTQICKVYGNSMS